MKGRPPPFRPHVLLRGWLRPDPPEVIRATPLLVAAFRRAGLDLVEFVRTHCARQHPVWLGAFRPLAFDRGRLAVVDAAGRVPNLVVFRRGASLDVSIELGGDVGLRTRGGLAWLSIPGLLPDTLAVALPGRRLSTLLTHPLLADDLKIDAVVLQPAFGVTGVGVVTPEVGLDGAPA